MEKLKGKFGVAVMIYFAFVASVFVYCGLIYFMKYSTNFKTVAMPDEQRNIMKYFLFCLSIIDWFMIKFTRKKLIQIKIENFRMEKADAETSGSNRENLIPDFLHVEIVTFAICESVAVYALLLFFTGCRTEDFASLMILSLIYFSYYFPKWSQWEEWTRALFPQQS